MKDLTSTISRIKDAQGEICISFYLPTHQAGMEVLNREDAILLKNQIKGVNNHLADKGYEESVIEEVLSRAKALVEDSGFWRKQQKGLAIFAKKDSLDTVPLPYTVEPETSVATEFEIVPLLPLLEGSGNYYVLALTQHQVKFYSGDREHLEEIMVEGITPMKLEEVVGTDYKPRTLQYRTSGPSESIFHGHGEWKGEFKKEELVKYLRAVDKGINQLLAGKNDPLVIAASPDMFAQYTAISTYPHLHSESVEINPEFIDLTNLQQASWNKIYYLFDKDRQEKENQVKQLHDTERTSDDLENILTNAMAGRVDTVFIQKGTKVWGTYEPAKHKLDVHDTKKLTSTSILNLLAKTVLAQRGRVYLQAPEAMPLSGSPVNALYRY